MVNFPQTPNDLIELMKDSERRKKLTEDDWLDIGNWMKENIKKIKYLKMCTESFGHLV